MSINFSGINFSGFEPARKIIPHEINQLYGIILYHMYFYSENVLVVYYISTIYLRVSFNFYIPCTLYLLYLSYTGTYIYATFLALATEMWELDFIQSLVSDAVSRRKEEKRKR